MNSNKEEEHHSKLAYARHFRKYATKAEMEVWSWRFWFRSKGYKLRRQAIVQGWIVDFWVPSARLVIEVDGKYHVAEEQKEKDAMWDGYLQSRGIRVLRVTDADVLISPLKVKRLIAAVLDESPSVLSDPPAGTNPVAPPIRGKGVITQDEYIEILFADVGFSNAQRRDYLQQRYGKRYIDEIPLEHKFALVDELKRMRADLD